MKRSVRDMPDHKLWLGRAAGSGYSIVFGTEIPLISRSGAGNLERIRPILPNHLFV